MLGRTRSLSPDQPLHLPWPKSSRLFVGLLLGLCLVQGLAHGQEPISLGPIHRYVADEMRRQHIPGMAVGILRDGRVLLRRGYGYANVELQVPASDSTVFQSGSLGKQFTAAAVAMLAEQGRLRLDDTIVRWLPEGSGKWDAVTVRALLTHTAGMAEYTDSTFDYRKDYTEDQLVRFAASRPLDFTPGERWSYSNTGYVLLGALIHRVTGRFYGDVLQQLIFTPLGMRTTRIISEADLVPNRAAGYQLVAGRLKNQDWVSPSLNTTADGSLYFSIDDLVRWAGALDRQQRPDSAVLRQAWAPVRLNDGGFYPYGFGWDLTPQRGHRRIGHTGSWQGFKTAIYRYPEFDLTVIALANLADAEPGPMAEAIAGMLEPDLLPAHLLKRPLKGAVPPERPEKLLAQLGKDRQEQLLTPGFLHFLSGSPRPEVREAVKKVESWTPLGCDDLTRLGLVWLSSRIAHACYATGKSPTDRLVATFYFSPDWRLAHFDLARF
jgi:CubicO group peptidase (beta-lactamase class C family)